MIKFTNVVCALIFLSVPNLVLANGNWGREVHVDQMSDEETVWYWVENLQPFSCSGGSSKARLYLTCTINGAAALLGTTNCIFDEEVFSFRVDDQQKEMVWATPQGSGQSVHLGSVVNKSNADHLVKVVATGRKLLLQIDPVSSSLATVEFKIDGLKDSVGSDFFDCLP
ncbi:hypothetical protein [Ruegeria sp. HKCCE4148]|uniref:hypothetical protein n=1 Tax=Ruegeria sp. HKCCE4148 TaxID=2794829 RepID=UPI001AE865D7|nr:hypothetical protein [Ruegeria sp. HKCCE4148]